ncbi:MAG TPA: GFA family protein [Dehalococcoidia bacterium]
MTGSGVLKLPADGACRCGRVRFRISAAPLLTMACHCRGCQGMTGSAYSLSAAIPQAAFTVTQGEAVIGGLHGATRHYFCSYCMSWIFTRPEGLDWLVNIRATLLEDPSWFAPFVEVYTAEGLPWAKTGALRSYPGLPAQETWPRLVEEYALLNRPS